MKTYLVLFLGLFLLAGCGGDGGSEDPTAPTDLSFVVDINEEGSGEVTVTATAENTKYYTFYFGDTPNNPVSKDNGVATYTYGNAGTYTIKVQAHATPNLFISKSENIEVEIDETVEIPEGPTSPESREGMTLAWADEFDGPTVNTTDNWTFEEGNGSGGWGNNELEYYTKGDNAFIQTDENENGYLVIKAKKEQKNGFAYTSTRMITKDKYEFTFGRVDIRARIPKGQGIWPALWTLGANISDEGMGWPKCGEIDIMEMVGGGGKEKSVHGTVHWHNDVAPIGYASYGGDTTMTSGTFSDMFHVYSIEWDTDNIKWLVDGKEFHRILISPVDNPTRFDEFRKDQFFIINLAVGGNWPGPPDAATIFPQHMIVDYIRVFQPE
jgi:beta-glucanase (GH16 family)